jgi:hypothetical protein
MKALKTFQKPRANVSLEYKAEIFNIQFLKFLELVFFALNNTK